MPAKTGTPCFVIDMMSPVLWCSARPRPGGGLHAVRRVGSKYMNGPPMRNEGAGIGPIAASIWAAIPCLARVCGHRRRLPPDLWITLIGALRRCRARGAAAPVRVPPVAVRCATRYKVAMARRAGAAASGGSRTCHAFFVPCLCSPATDPT
ncbi:hypothetical protein CBM2599_B51125 [Cupriavidus taiwanensis]|uniref:Uncharacterized protein n=1 Tax=Cupriavidus taiwanensis TaxID=164546 RepID=A0A9Q7V0U3_9BURK|nr:hypothetical protein CBM2599_B51125 [Cupriavidus taiwanensis]SPD68221.1 protein of unknown function [Cupriavidus taiwanensis]